MPYTQVDTLTPTDFAKFDFAGGNNAFVADSVPSDPEVRDLNKYSLRFNDGKHYRSSVKWLTHPHEIVVDFYAKLSNPSLPTATIFSYAGFIWGGALNKIGLSYSQNNFILTRGNYQTTVPGTNRVPPLIGSWHRYTVRFGSDYAELFIDGVSAGGVLSQGVVMEDFKPSSYTFLWLGRRSNGSVAVEQGLVGDIVQFRTFHGPATIEEVLAYDNTPLQIREDGVNCLRMDEQRSVSKPLLLDYTKWVVGQTPPSPFSLNGSLSENQIISNLDPWGFMRPIWRAFPDATSGPDGGWNASVPASSDNTYRLTCFIRRDVIGNGYLYFGCQTNLGKVQNRSDLSDNTNPYFWSGLPALTDWMLFVSYCHKNGTPANISMPDTGIYRMDGTKLDTSVAEFILPPGITAITHRSYLYYSTDVNTRQSWCYPRIDIVDGSEPSVSELLAGYDSNIYDTVKVTNNTPKALSFSNSIRSDFTEIGITRGLQLYLPFTTNKNDYWRGMHALVDTGNEVTYDNSVPPITGTLFQNTTNSQYLSIPLADLGIESGKDFTVTFLSRVTSTPPTGTLFSLYDNINNQPGISYHFRSGLTYNLRMNPVGTVSEIGQLSSGISSSDTWVFFAVSLNARTGKITRYRQNLNATQSAPFEFTAVPNLVYDELRIAAGLNNVISEFKVFNVALTSAEMVTEYLRNTALASVGKGIIQTDGTFNEL